jgi:penicillin-binding protein 1C
VKRLLFCILLLTAQLAHAAVPTPAQVQAAWRPSEARLLDRHGDVLHTMRIDPTVRRADWVALADISPALGRAVLQAEDSRFMEHGGVDLRAVGQAAWEALAGGMARTRGASTITMQLAGLLDPALAARAAGRSWRQKWDQALAARELEAGWRKAQILEAYLNLASFRGELQGIGAASRGLFGKAPSGLDTNESAILASLLRAPSAPEKLVARRACTLVRELQGPTAAKVDCAAIEWQVASALGRPRAMAAPDPLAQRLLGGQKRDLRSTLDAGLQRFAREALRRHLAELAGRNVGDGALVVIDNASGEVLAYAANNGSSEIDGVTALRQAGSTLKPFLYELAIERGQLTAASLLDDSPVGIPTTGGLYVPQNYDRHYRALASVRTSLASSLNVPAVRTLMLAGLERFHARLGELGISSLDQDASFYGYSLALGSADVSLLALSNAYRTLANGGQGSSITFVPRAPPPMRRLLDTGAVFIVADILADRAARSATFGLRNELATGFWSAVKTGTSKDMRDNWCVGFSQRYTVGVWVGNFDGRSMWDVSGVAGAAPVWRDLMDYLHRDVPSRAPAPPSGVLQRTVTYAPAVEPARAEWFMRGTETALVQALAPAERAPQIVYPAAQSIIALDPDIPPQLQRVVFRAQAGKGLRWRLDKVDLGPADQDVAWTPVAGAHRLTLSGGEKNVAEVDFEVRGSNAANDAQPASTLSTSSGGSLPRSASAAAETEAAAAAAGAYSGESER